MNKTIISIFSIILLTFFAGNARAQIWPGNYSIANSIDILNLSGYTGINGTLTIAGYTGSDLSGLESLTTVGGDLYIFSSSGLTSLNGLNNLTSVGGDLAIETNNALTSLNGLESLTSVGGGLFININISLTSLNALGSLTSVGGILEIGINPSLTSLSGLEGLTSLGGSLYINDNTVLTSLCGLYNVSLSGSALTIVNNTVLSMGTANALKTQLINKGFTGTSTISNNTGSGLVTCIWLADYIINNIDDILVLWGYVGVSGSLTIQDYTGSDLSRLDNLTSVGGSLIIENNDALTSLDGLRNIFGVSENLFIYGNDALTNLNGLSGLSGVEGNLYIQQNSVLTNLCALYNMNLFGDNLYIYNNTSLSMDTALALEAQLRSNDFTGIADIHDNNGSELVSCDCNVTSVIPSSGTQIILGNTSESNNDAVPSCRTSSTAPDDLYVFTLGNETMVTASVTGFDTVLHLRGVCDDPGTELACNDDNSPPGSLGSLVSETLPPGEYSLIVDGYGTNSGAYQLSVDFENLLPCGNDGDDICDDGDNSGTAGDNPCTGGDTTSCDDNCPLKCNSDQLDADEDGIGDVCDSTPGCGGGCGQSECEDSCGGCGG